MKRVLRVISHTAARKDGNPTIIVEMANEDDKAEKVALVCDTVEVEKFPVWSMQEVEFVPFLEGK